jgi:hypothetical protein
MRLQRVFELNIPSEHFQNLSPVSFRASFFICLIFNILKHILFMLQPLRFKGLLEFLSWNCLYKVARPQFRGVQLNAAEVCLCDIPYTSGVEKLNLPTVIYLRKRGDMIRTFKLPSHEKFILSIFQINNFSRTIRHNRKLFKKRGSTRLRSKFFSNRVVSLWDSLHQDTASSVSTDSFKSSVDKEWCNKHWRLIRTHLISRHTIFTDQRLQYHPISDRCNLR